MNHRSCRHRKKNTNEVVACAVATHVWLNVESTNNNAVRVELRGHGNMTCSSLLGKKTKHRQLEKRSQTPCPSSTKPLIAEQSSGECQVRQPIIQQLITLRFSRGQSNGKNPPQSHHTKKANCQIQDARDRGAHSFIHCRNFPGFHQLHTVAR